MVECSHMNLGMMLLAHGRSGSHEVYACLPSAKMSDAFTSTILITLETSQIQLTYTDHHPIGHFAHISIIHIYDQTGGQPFPLIALGRTFCYAAVGFSINIQSHIPALQD